MRLTGKAVLAGLASIALGGAAAAAGTEPRYNIMIVALPNGGTATIHHTGDVPPRIAFGAVAARAMPPPIGAWRGMDPPPFATFDRIVAAMEARAAAMLRMATLAAQAPQAVGPRLDLVSGPALPRGMAGYRLVSQVASDGACTRSVTVASEGAGKKPKVFTQTSGDCAAPKAAAGAADEKPAAPAPETRDRDALRTI
ncbi:hypothetical protein [Sphingosinicella terrae]|uniref:hypothetical protein n=1 Tax=Sphingosinicella terrae TaxID=2172047 RepID=UPI0013B3DDF6|nr:hypothetical protein [Sphingosinicella terrae]